MTSPIIQRLQQLQDGKDSLLLRFGLGSALFNAKDFAAAEAHLSVCVQQMPDHSAAWKLLGRSRQSLGDREGAQYAFSRGLDVARAKGDKQVEREIEVFQRKLQKGS